MRKLAITGRANVGKSSIYNKLLSLWGQGWESKALVSDKYNHTNTTDGKRFIAKLHGFNIQVADTAPFPKICLPSPADISLLVVDAKEGVTPLDRQLAQLINTAILVANKCDNQDQDANLIADLYELDLGHPIFLSTFSNAGWDQLDQRVRNLLLADKPTINTFFHSETSSRRITLVGRANTGKSSLYNALLGRSEATISQHAGTTTDALENFHEFQGKRFIITDTAGVTKRWRQTGAKCSHTGADTLQALRSADVVVLVMDAQEILLCGSGGLSRQEMTIAKEASDLGKSVMLVINKFDLISPTKESLLRRAIEEKAQTAFSQLKGLPILYTSAKTGLNVNHILSKAENLFNKNSVRIETSRLNAWLRAFVVHYPVPWKDKMLCQLKFIKQVDVQPLTFALWTNIHHEFPDNYLQLLKNTLRDEFKLHGPPIRLLLRSTFVPKKVMKARKFERGGRGRGREISVHPVDDKFFNLA